jgi:hypothetical protein
MLHVITVHWHDERWLELQLRYFDRFLPAQRRVYASLNGIPAKWSSSFYYAADLEGDHHRKLNALVEIAAKDATPDDLLLFIDSDAFPIAPVNQDLLRGFPLAAVRRDENMGEQQPHPCFCLTTMGFWSEIDGDWGRGYEFAASNGVMVTDGGANLLGKLRARNIEWRPLLRSNKRDLHPLFFAIYGNVVYHHGAGSRRAVTWQAGLPGRKAMSTAADQARIPSAVPVLHRLERSARYRLARRRHLRAIEDYAARSQKLSDEVFASIVNGDEFYRQFL